MARIPEYVAENYTALREERGLSWDELADQFDKEGYTDLSEWAREEGSKSDKSARANKGRETAAKSAPSRRG